MCEHGGGAGGPVVATLWPWGWAGGPGSLQCGRLWWFRRELGNCFSGALLVEVVSGGVWSRENGGI